MVYGGQIQGFVYKGLSEIRPRQFEANFETRAAQPVVIRIVHVKDEVHRSAAQSETRDVYLLQIDLGLLERECVS